MTIEKPGRPPPRNPFHIFMMVLVFLASIPALAGNAGSASLDQRLDDITVQLWGCALLLGSLLDLIGLMMPRRHRMLGLLIERSGLILVGGGAVIYAGVIYVNASELSDVRFTAALHLGFGLACVWRAIQVTSARRWARETAVASERPS